jgi:hypothetical protein
LASNHLWAHIIPASAKKRCGIAQKKKNSKIKKQWKEENSVPADEFVCTIDPTDCFGWAKLPQ